MKNEGIANLDEARAYIQRVGVRGIARIPNCGERTIAELLVATRLHQPYLDNAQDEALSGISSERLWDEILRRGDYPQVTRHRHAATKFNSLIATYVRQLVENREAERRLLP